MDRAELLRSAVDASIVDVTKSLTLGAGGSLVSYLLGIESQEDILRDVRGQLNGIEVELGGLRQDLERLAGGLDGLQDEIAAARNELARLQRGPLLAARRHLANAADEALSPGLRIQSLDDARKAFINALGQLTDPDDLWSAHRQLGIVWTALGGASQARGDFTSAHSILTARLHSLWGGLTERTLRLLELPNPPIDRDLVKRELLYYILRQNQGTAEAVGTGHQIRARAELGEVTGPLFTEFLRKYVVRWHLCRLADGVDLYLDADYSPDLEPMRRRLHEFETLNRIPMEALAVPSASARLVSEWLAQDELLGPGGLNGSPYSVSRALERCR